MRIALVSLAAVAAVAAATPAFADEARIGATTGVIWDAHNSDATAGVEAGYDYDLGNTGAFIGVEGSATKVLASNNRVSWGAGGRIGFKVLPQSKLYAMSEWQSKNCKYCNSAVAVGAGWQQNFTNRYYGKVEYQHLLIGDNTPDADVGLVGVGVKF
ncbi:outer membrane protein [Novosphingobium sp. 9]|uniref:outer membrane protein n=1 Tax=Novosphingobium sp. 9 TaxID=2025349 RepID=UPI0021B67044|nr:hypothetical protein [Novosphingobium sp. 9]